MIRITSGALCEAVCVRKRIQTYLLARRCLYFLLAHMEEAHLCIVLIIIQREAETKKRKRASTHTLSPPLLPFSLGCSLITLLDLSACGWAHYRSTLALLLPETVPPFRSSPGAWHVTVFSHRHHLITDTQEMMNK